MKNLPILLFFLFFSSGVLAQQTDLSSLYRYNWQILNPGAVNHTFLEDKSKKYIFNSAYRQQWVGVEGGPVTYNARFEYFPDNNPIKVGGYVLGDRAGAIGTNSVFGNFAYLIKLNQQGVESYISVGLNLGAVWYNVDMGEIRFQEDQPNLMSEGVLNQSYADMALGAFYRWKNLPHRVLPVLGLSEFYAGVSVPQTFTMNMTAPDEGAFDLERVQHYYLITGAVFLLTSDFLLEPSTWVRYVPNGAFQTLFNNAPVSADVNLRLKYNNMFWIGGGFSTNRLIHTEFGADIGRGLCENCGKNYLLTLALAYDAPVGWNSQLPGSLEISLGLGWE